MLSPEERKRIEDNIKWIQESSSHNEWSLFARIPGTYERWCKCNTVYLLNCVLNESTMRKRGQREEIPAWEASGWLLVRTPKPYDNSRVSGAEIYHFQKTFETKEPAGKYLHEEASRLDRYFQEECPAIPKSHAYLFSVDGQLLPGYRLEE